MQVPKRVALMSELVNTMIEGDAEEKEIPLPNVQSAVLQKAIIFMTQHADNPMQDIEKPLTSTDMHQVVSKWDADFVDVENELLFQMISVRIHIVFVVCAHITRRNDLGCQLHGHQVVAGTDVCQGGQHDQRQDNG